MKQLEIRPYSRQEMAQIIHKKADSPNFVRDVRSILDSWGYTCELPRGGAVIITRKPETAKEQLAEIMIRLFNLDVQIDVYGFACFLHLMLTKPEAQRMPWGVRHSMIKEMYGQDVSEITLRRWTKHLLDADILSKSQCPQSAEWWMTYNDSATGKHQEAVDDSDLPKVHQYWQRHGEVLSEMRNVYNGNESLAWSETKKAMWAEFGCCYYRCKCLQINGIGHEEIATIVALLDEILNLDWESSNVDQT